jgi:hypothetical protein
MRSPCGWSCLLVVALNAAACSSWSGPGKEDGTGNTDNSIDGRDAGVSPMHHADGGSGDGGHHSVTDAGTGDDDLPGDSRMDFVACDTTSCSGADVCCSSSRGIYNYCEVAAECGDTDGSFDCDGPEDCKADEICCHVTADGAPSFDEDRIHGACIAAEIAPETQETDGGVPVDAGLPVRQCVGPLQHVACHKNSDCADAPGTPLCHPASLRGFIGYCSAQADDPATPGNDDPALVGCGDADHDGVGTICIRDEQLCCLSGDNSRIAACTVHEECGGSALQVLCDGPEDCNDGNVCCYAPKHDDADGGVVEAATACQESCEEPALTRCHTSEQCDEGFSCQPDEASPWWGRCVREQSIDAG